MLVDSNTSLCILQPRHQQHQTALDAVRILVRRGEQLCVAQQNLVEVWVVATRPFIASNGLGMSTKEAFRAIEHLKYLFTVLAEREYTYAVWEWSVVQHRVSGKAAHDARIVAAMMVYGLKAILTFNTGDFTRYPGIKVVHPVEFTAPGLLR